jgi:hypothetical protein
MQGIFLSWANLSNLTFGIFCAVVILLFVYYMKLWGQVGGINLVCEFWSSAGNRKYIVGYVAKEMLIDKTGLPLTKEQEAALTDDEKKQAQIVAEIGFTDKVIKKNPELKQTVYYTRRGLVDSARWPIGQQLIPITVPARICSWSMGCSEPIDPSEEHKKLPITSSPGFASGVRDHDSLMQTGMMLESFQNFMADMAAKMQAYAKGGKSKGMLIGLIVVGVLVVAAIAISVMVLSKLQAIGV